MNLLIVIQLSFLANGLIMHFIRRLSEVLNTKIESKDLVKSEIVQAIFRTQARIGKPISIAFFYNYNEKLLDRYDPF